MIPKAEIYQGEVLDVARVLGPKSVDLVICSPPYEKARTYGIGFKLKGQDWVDWAVERFMAGLEVSRGAVLWVVGHGMTVKYKWSAAPALMMADLHRRGVTLRNPLLFHRVGIPGSGGPDWFRGDTEFIICATAERGKLPWSDNKAAGHPPKWGPGGEMSHRLTDGTRRNQWGAGTNSTRHRRPSGKRDETPRPSHEFETMEGKNNGSFGNKPSTAGRRPDGSHKKPYFNGRGHPGARFTQTREREGMHNQDTPYKPPQISNPGNVFKCLVGGGVMGSRLAHENEAPYPESLVDPIMRSLCPPGGRVWDCFGGSGTTLAVAIKNGRVGISSDVRMSQCELMQRRVREIAPLYVPEIQIVPVGGKPADCGA